MNHHLRTLRMMLISLTSLLAVAYGSALNATAAAPRIQDADQAEQTETENRFPAYIRPMVESSALLDEMIERSEHRDQLGQLRQTAIDSWAEGAKKAERMWDASLVEEAVQIDRNFLDAVIDAELDPNGLITLAIDASWCDYFALAFSTFPPFASIRLEDDHIRDGVPEILLTESDLVPVLQELVAREVRLGAAVLDVFMDGQRQSEAIKKWMGQRQERINWKTRSLASDDSAEQLKGASGDLSLFIPVATWIRQDVDDAELIELCSALETELTERWLRYKDALARAQTRGSDVATKELYIVWRRLIAAEGNNITTVLSVCEDKQISPPRHVRLIHIAATYKGD